jgi:hypothetical protein
MGEQISKGEQELKNEGWILASVSGGDHLKRTLDMYHELGFETYLEGVKPEECDGCTECYSTGNEIVYRIYTRSLKEAIE